MSNLGFLYGKDDSAVENLISQANDLYVLEQVAAINCSSFTDSALPTNLETRFHRLKSLPVFTRPVPVSPSKKLLSHSKSMAGYSEKKIRGNASSASAFSGDEEKRFSGVKRDPSVKSRPLVSYDEETRILPGIKRVQSLNSGFEKNSRGGLVSETSEDFSDSEKIDYSVPSIFSRDGKIFSATTSQTLKFLPEEKLRISSSSFTSIDLASPSSDLDRKSKSESMLSTSWFGKLSPSRAMGCLWHSPSKSSSNSKKTKKQQRIV